MKKNEIITKLTNDISRNVYRATIEEHLKNLGYVASMMEWQAATEFGKAFEAIEVLTMITESDRGDKVYREAQRDAEGTIETLSDRYGYTKKYFVSLLNEAGYDGKAHYEIYAKWDDNLPQ